MITDELYIADWWLMECILTKINVQNGPIKTLAVYVLKSLTVIAICRVYLTTTLRWSSTSTAGRLTHALREFVEPFIPLYMVRVINCCFLVRLRWCSAVVNVMMEYHSRVTFCWDCLCPFSVSCSRHFFSVNLSPTFCCDIVVFTVHALVDSVTVLLFESR